MPHFTEDKVWHLFYSSVAFQLLKCGIGNNEVRHYSYLIELAG